MNYNSNASAINDNVSEMHEKIQNLEKQNEALLSNIDKQSLMNSIDSGVRMFGEDETP